MEPIKASALAHPRFKANPYPFYARMRVESPVFPISVPFIGRGWVVTRYEDVVTVAKDDRFSRDILPLVRWLPGFVRVPLTRQMLSQDPPDHTRLRKLVSQAFTPGRIERLRDHIQAVCDQLLEAAPPTGSFDLVRNYALPLPLTVIAELLGIPKQDRQRFHRLAQGIVPIGVASGILDIPMALPYVWLIERYFRRLFAKRRAHPGDDLLSALVQAEQAGDRLDEDELLGIAMLLLVAGYETTAHLIGSAALALLQHPEQRARFVTEPGLAHSAIEELLRYTNRDESVFRDPETLDLARDPNPHVAFGQGRHFCLGASLARMEAQIALTTLFARFPGLRLAQPAESIHWRKLLPLRGLTELPVAGLA